METQTTTVQTPAAPKARKPRKDKGIKRGPKTPGGRIAQIMKEHKANKKAAKKPARAKDHPKNDDKLVPADLSRYTTHEGVKTANGNRAVDIADEVANKLRGKAIEDAYVYVADRLSKLKGEDISAHSLKKRFGNLNLGMQRMNIGNMLRAAIRAKEAAKAA